MEFIAFSPEEIVEKFGWSPRHVRKLAREIGACRILGNRMVLLEEDVKAILDATKPQPTSTATRSAPPPGLKIRTYADLVKYRNSKPST